MESVSDFFLNVSKLFDASSLLTALPIENIDRYEAKSNFVLQSNTSVELGGKNASSALLSLYSAEEVSSDEIRLIGQNLPDLQNQQINFGVVIRFLGNQINDELFYILSQNIKRLLQIKGLMLKGCDSEIWCRISQDTFAEGLTFQKWGSIFLSRLHQEFPEIKSCQILFISGASNEFNLLSDLVQKQTQYLKLLKSRVWESRGYSFKDCHVLGHCGQCSDKKLCANVRKMERIVQVTRKVNQKGIE